MSTIRNMDNIKTLGELKEKYKGTVKLGTVGGAAFIYCGKIENLDIKELGVRFSTLDRERLIKNDKKIDSTRNTTREEYERLLSIRNKRLKTDLRPSEEGYKEWKRRTEAELERRKKYREKLLNKLNKLYNFEARTIIRMYPSADEDDTLIVIIEGKEIGNAWTTEEYKNGGK